MQQITAGLNKLKLDYIPSFRITSFRIGNATAMYQRLLKRGIIVRPVANYGMPEYLRVSIDPSGKPEIFKRVNRRDTGIAKDKI